MISIGKPTIGKEEVKAAAEVLKSGRLTQGEQVEKFEKEFAAFVGTKFAVAVSNGTTALQLALLAAGIGEGDEVITTPHTFIATAASIVQVGAKPVFVDVKPDSLNIDPEKIEEVVTTKTKAIIAVHLYGLPADMPAINKIAKKHKLIVIEDSAQAHGAQIRGKRTGSLGDLACFSFYATKNMTTGEGGMVTTNKGSFAEEIQILRDQGQKGRYKHVMLGFNYRMTDIAAAIGRAQLKKLPAFNKKRIENAAYLTKKLNGIKGIKTPFVPAGYRHVFYLYTAVVENDYPINRDQLLAKLNKSGVDARIYYPVLLSDENMFKSYKRGSLDVVKKIHKQILSLPSHPSLTRQELGKIAEVIKNGAKD